MISRSRSSVERSPPLASGWWRFTSSLKRTLIFAVVASPSSPSASSALRSALRMTRVSRRRRCSPFCAVAEQLERIVGALERRPEPRRARAPGRLAAVHAHLPGRAMADHRLALVARDVVGAHAGEEIVGVVVLAHVVEAEPPILLLAHRAPSARDGSRRRRSPAIRTADAAPQPPVLVGLDPDAIKEWRVAGHDRSLCGRGAEPSSLDFARIELRALRLTQALTQAR